MTLLELRDVVVEYKRPGQPPVRAVAGVDLEVGAGEIVGLVGETGCGKSSLARAIVGLVGTESGSIRFDGESVTQISRKSRSTGLRRLQMIFQDPSSSLNPRRKVGAQLKAAIELAGTDTARRPAGSAELLEQVGLPASAAERFPHEFSGGQRQRISIARALAARPRLIVADEPIAALDASAQAQIANLLVSLSRELSLSLVFISHDLSIVRHVADRTAVMYLGKVVELAPTRQLWDTPGHPYTRALTGAVPRVGSPGDLPTELPGDVPDPARPPSGCRFHPRCPIRIDKCRTEEPPAATGPGRTSFCWRTDFGNPAAPIPLTTEESGKSDAQPARTSS
jgi:peptide/nickel transport system ATP-binding protein